MKIVKIFTTFLFLIFSTKIFCQTLELKEDKKNDLTKKNDSNNYIVISAGRANSDLRDFGTSPLVYSGRLLNLGAKYLYCSNKSEWNIGLSYSFGTYNVTRGNYFQINANVFLYEVSWYRQWFEGWFSNKLNIKLGANVIGITNFRRNNIFSNAGYSSESFNTLFVTGKVERKLFFKGKQIKFLFIKYHWKPRNLKLSYRISLPLLNTYIRPQYSYFYFTKNAWNRIKIGGYRLSTEMEFIYYLLNGNAFGISYYWDALSTNSKYNKLELAHHLIQFKLLLKLN